MRFTQVWTNLKGLMAAEAVPVQILEILQHSLSLCVYYDLYDCNLLLLKSAYARYARGEWYLWEI